ncbi:MAG TPA: hypothetical protein VHV51_22645 [Polyangiaceae bacterium]|jgi:hypothetical protein|nr:hypothetical protein [Polyangiaceae bacterium]
MTRVKPKPLIPKRAAAKPPRTNGPSKNAPVKAADTNKTPSKLEALPRPARATASAPSNGKLRVDGARAEKAAKPKLAALTVKAPAKAALGASPEAPSPAKAKTKGAGPSKPVLVDTPAKIRPIEQAVGVTSDAVARRTGKSWAEWFALLDAAGAAELDHKGIVAVLAQRHGVGPWWQQMVTVAYEQARGKREKHEAEEGFQVGVSKILELPIAKLFRFWAEPAERNKWLADDRFSIHKATASKSIRARWGRGVSRIDVDFLDKGAGKSQVTVQHNRIETSDAAEQMKAYWAKKIRALEALTRP